MNLKLKYILSLFIISFVIACDNSSNNNNSHSNNNQSTGPIIKKLFVAVGSKSSNGNGYILTSEDSKNWTIQHYDNYDLRDVIYGNGLFIAVGSAGVILTSTDGINWNNEFEPGNWFSKITYSKGLFTVSAGSQGDSLYSYDGATWNKLSGTGIPLSRTFGNSTHVGIGFATSTDGINWTAVEKDKNQENFVGSAITFGNGLFVAAGRDSELFDTSWSLGRIMVSSNGTDWKNVVKSGPLLTDLAYGNNIYVAVGYEGRILTSTDGVFWHDQNIAINHVRSITFGNGIFIATCGVNFLSSTDGINWEKIESENIKSCRGITYGEVVVSE